jgi:ABC-type transporter Mla subunit MlaD
MQHTDEQIAQQMNEDSQLLEKLLDVLDQEAPTISSCLNSLIHLIAHVANQSEKEVPTAHIADAIEQTRALQRQVLNAN